MIGSAMSARTIIGMPVSTMMIMIVLPVPAGMPTITAKRGASIKPTAMRPRSSVRHDSGH
jgi:hypothetical protein